MKIQFTMLFFLVFAISAIGQNIENKTNQAIGELPCIEIKSIKSNLEENGTQASKCSSSSSNCSVITSTSEQDKKRYTTLRERHSSRYPISRKSKTPELQLKLQEIRF